MAEIRVFRRSWWLWGLVGLALGVALSVFNGREALLGANQPPPLSTLALQLIRHDGTAFYANDLSGRHSLIYFGYTHCPDVCPIGLFSVASLLEALQGSGRDLQPLFVTLDPERDTRAVMAGYVKAFHPDIVGLTGSGEAIRKLADAMDVRYQRDGEDGDYLVSHTAFTYLVSPEGEVLRSFPDGFKVDFALNVIEQEVPVADKG